MAPRNQTRNELNEEATSAGVENPEALPNKEAVAAAIEEAPDTFVADVVAHLADPQRVPAPAGAVINFGDPQPIRRNEG
jgi:hypothetical protein